MLVQWKQTKSSSKWSSKEGWSTFACTKQKSNLATYNKKSTYMHIYTYIYIYNSIDYILMKFQNFKEKCYCPSSSTKTKLLPKFSNKKSYDVIVAKS